MRTIWKYPLPVIDRFDLPLPTGATSLTVQMQRGEPCLWALVNPHAPTTIRQFVICGTGNSVPFDAGNYIGTFQMEGGALVFHLFEVNR